MTIRLRRLPLFALVLLPLAACGGSGGSSRSADGIVARLTGDDDSEVSDPLEDLVQKAFYIPKDGAPIDD